MFRKGFRKFWGLVPTFVEVPGEKLLGGPFCPRPILSRVKTLISLQRRIYVNKIENTITFKIKTGYYLELLTSGTINLLGSTKIAKNENGENVPHLEINEVVLVHCNIVKNNYQQDSRVLHTFVPNKSFGQLLDISPKNAFKNLWFRISMY